ncbi:ROK family protein [Sinorhizobium meliloti]|jgi:predicted NBD/HSP70 family sugar kinase|uniref:ROK family transcriptional regulator n=1 Tax=Rhizobium meliloti TaxID=382 RepID=UPI0002FC1D83|nr:ROK family transcriptional regulator [Sinorhizobium meliloti]ARS68240.1 transcriptional regulator [Sinorhizobium meliloti RU11/001]MCO5963567.1 ROK family transcriptional regulator [Sinorhizobium meliloti]MDE3786711.1 ROK family transcriptional regulator [Sinorhizobium meliloti]MDE3795227.1 ROK family transcriptional regulator [Sinorhizobium meliloti]MDE4603426.1 ROK family transcriptional regulator [Sinorhizobium meliloti]
MLTKSSTELVRQQNSALVLAALRRKGSLSHTEIAAQTGLASATISVITAELERSGIIAKTEQHVQGGRGRPRVLFEPRRGCGYVIVVRISSDVVQYSLADYGGILLDRFEDARSHDLRGTAAFGEVLAAALERLLVRSNISKDEVLAISISSKGLVAGGGARLIWSPVFGREQLDFVELLRPAWRARIMLSNESLLVAHALAVREEERERGFHALAAVSLGHSIGLGLARRGKSGELDVSAPDFGHMLHQASAGLCRCGSYGCIEAAAGFYGILRTAFEVPSDTIPAKFVPLSEVDKIAASARQGNRMGGYAFRQAGLALGNGISRMLSLYEPMPIFVTGPGTRYFDLLEKGLEEGLAHSLQVRLQGMPQIRVVPDEQRLVFDGHLDRALGAIDGDIAAAGHP